MRNEPPPPSNLIVERLQSGGTYYFSLIGIALVIGYIGAYFGRGAPVAFGQSAAVLLPLVMMAGAVVLWSFLKDHARQTFAMGVLCFSLIAYWALATASAATSQAGRNYLTFLVPLSLVMLLMKPPKARAVEITATFLSWVTLMTAVAVETVDRLVGPMPDHRWPMWLAPLQNLGFQERWSGPFGHPNIAGPILALCLVFAISRSGWQRFVLGSLASLFLLLTLSRTAMLAALSGTLLYFALKGTSATQLLSRKTRVIVAILILASVVVLAVAYDPTLDGRDSAYTDYLRIWIQHPWFGAGEAGIRNYVANVAVDGFHAHAHNVLIDSLARYGLIGAVLLLLTIGASLGLSWSIAKTEPWPFALVVTFIVISVAESPFDPLYLSIPVLWVLIAATYASACMRQGPSSALTSPD